MDADGWYLKEITDFIYLLDYADPDDQEGRTILQKRFKKDKKSYAVLYQFLRKIDDMGYEDGMSFSFASARMDTIKGTPLDLIEIRVKESLWRVITYRDSTRKKLVMLDAFEHHKHKAMSEMVKQVYPRVRTAQQLLEEII